MKKRRRVRNNEKKESMYFNFGYQYNAPMYIMQLIDV